MTRLDEAYERIRQSIIVSKEKETQLVDNDIQKAYPTNKTKSIEETLKDRGSKYGEFSSHATITQILKDAMREHKGWNNLSAAMQESLDMIQHKIGRILNGNPTYKDSWVDIEGYAHLVSERLSDE